MGSLHGVVPLLLLSLSVAGCEMFMAGGCEHTYREPVLTIQRVVAPGGQLLPVVVLDSVTINGGPLELRYGLGMKESARGAETDGTSITCTTPCGLGSLPGRYAFDVRGIAAARVTIDASYRTFHGGCPSWNDDGTNAVVVLRSP